MPETEVQSGKRGRKAAIKAEKATAPVQEPPPEDAPRKPTRPSKSTPEGGPTFWQKIAAVEKADWGPRANIYLYRLEPVIDRRRSGTLLYITKYQEPVSEDRILADHGSGRYKAVLNFRKPGAEQGDEIDSIYLDLLNLQFPPKIAPGDWVDDPNNKKWAWARQHFQPEPGPQTGVDPMKMLETYDKIRTNVAKDQPDPDARMLTIATIFEKLQPKQSAPDEQFKNFAAAFQLLQPKDSGSQWESRLEAAEKRADENMKMVLELLKGDKKSDGIKGVVDAVKELEPLIDKFLPGLANKATEALSGRSRMSGIQEFIVSLAPSIQETLKPFSMLFAELIASRAMQSSQNAAARNGGSIPAALPPGQPAPSAGAPDPTGSMIGFLGMLTTPLLAKIRLAAPSDDGEPVDPAILGDEFGSWVLEGYGVDPQYPGALQMAKTIGPAGIIAQFRSVPKIWNDKGQNGKQPSLAELEPKLTAFFTAFLNYKPEETDEPESEDEPEQTDPAQPAVVDFDREYAHA